MAGVTLLQEVELVGRLMLACGLAGALGLERQLGQQPAGLRTHMLVSLGAAAFTVAGISGVSGHGTVQDAGRIAAQIVVGIGFIGAGSIWRSDNERVIRGLTTAASIWVAASIGMLCGYGLYVLAIGSTVLTLIVLRLLRGLENLPASIWRVLTRPGDASVSPDAGSTGTEGAPPLEPVQHPAVQDSALNERQRERRRTSGKKKRKARQAVQEKPAD